MNSTLKGILHAVISAVGVWLPTIITSVPAFNITLGALLTIVFNILASRFIPTTTGASANQ